MNLDQESKLFKDKKCKGLEELLLNFTVNCLIEQPSQVIPYAKTYFQNIIEESEGKVEEDGYLVQGDAQDEMVDPVQFRRTRGGAVFSEAYNPAKDDRVEEEEEDQYHEKTDNQRQKLRNVIVNCLLFRNIDPDDFERLLDAFFEKKVQQNEIVMEQGEEGDNFYIIDKGFFNAYINGELVMTYKNNGTFGELSLMYNVPRAATVKALSPGIIWGLDRKTFRKIVVKGAFKKKQMYEEFLLSVPMLQELEPSERQSIADALKPLKFSEGDCIIRQGDQANGMYFIEQGAVEIRVSKVDDKEVLVKELGVGGYFGELALVTRKPRAASVYANTNVVKVAFLDVDAFERLLGPCMEIMKRNIDTYEEQRRNILKKSFIEIEMT